jgi:hypothetical protein
MEYSRHSPDMSYADFGHPVFDCDFHLYEGADAFTRHLPEKYKGLVRLANVDGRTKMIIRGKVSDYIPNPTFEVVAEPGSAAEYFSGRNTEGKSYREIVRPMRAIPEFTDRDARLALMDRMHIDSIVNFPTLASTLEVNFSMTRSAPGVDPRSTSGCTTVGPTAPGIFTTPVVNPPPPSAVRSSVGVERGGNPRPARPSWLPGHEVAVRRQRPVLGRGAGSRIQSCSARTPAEVRHRWGGTEIEMSFRQDAWTVSQSHRPIMNTIFSAVIRDAVAVPDVKLARLNGADDESRRGPTDGCGRCRTCSPSTARRTQAAAVGPVLGGPLQPLID